MTYRQRGTIFYLLSSKLENIFFNYPTSNTIFTPALSVYSSIEYALFLTANFSIEIVGFNSTTFNMSRIFHGSCTVVVWLCHIHLIQPWLHPRLSQFSQLPRYPIVNTIIHFFKSVSIEFYSWCRAMNSTVLLPLTSLSLALTFVILLIAICDRGIIK